MGGSKRSEATGVLFSVAIALSLAQQVPVYGNMWCIVVFSGRSCSPVWLRPIATLGLYR